jgi:ActR/RegA family two-component response regulator
MDETMNDPVGLLLCDDLIFSSRITGTAKALGLSLRTMKIVSDLLHFARQTPPRCVIIDLNSPGLIIDDLVGELGMLTRMPLIVGYGSHVDTATLKKARDAGFDIVWPRSKFVEELPTALPVWFKDEETTS